MNYIISLNGIQVQSFYKSLFLIDDTLTKVSLLVINMNTQITENYTKITENNFLVRIIFSKKISLHLNLYL